MADGKSALPSIQQYEELKIPSEWTGEQRRFAQRLIGIIDDIYRKYGRFELSDLGKGLRKWVDGVDGSMLEIIESAQGLLARVTNAEGNISEIQLTAQGIATRVSDIEGDISEIQQTALGILMRVANAEGDISEVRQTAKEIIARVTDAEGDISEIQQTAQGILTRVEDAEGDISTIRQTAKEIIARVTDAEGGISEIQLTTDGIAAAVKNNRLRFTANGLEIINAAGDVVFRQDNATGGLTITGIIRALGGVIGGFTIADGSLHNGNRIVLDAVNGIVRLGQLMITDSLSAGPVLEALAGISVIVGGGLYMAFGNNGVTVQRTLYAQSGFYINPSRVTDKPANLYVDPTTGEVLRTTNTGGGGVVDPGGSNPPPSTLAAFINVVPSSPKAGDKVYINMGASGGTQPYTRYMLRILQPNGSWSTVYDGADSAYGPLVFLGDSQCTATATVWDSAGTFSVASITFYISAY